MLFSLNKWFPQLQAMKYIATVFLVTFIIPLNAQFILQGRVLESKSQRPVDYATVIVKEKQTEKVVAGSTTENGGTFEIELSTNEVRLEIRFIGFQTKQIEDIKFREKKADLGDILIYEDAAQLDEVVVEGERSTTEFKLDKRVFNVGKDLSSTGASALEVLNNVPSVNVNIEGEISLRGATGVQILIDGKPSVLADGSSNALGTITADMIERVEVITNPSAKYEAQGTAGILNIVLKKEEKKGANGSLSVNTGVPHNHSVGFSMNKRTDRFNLFTQLGLGYRELPREMENINRDKESQTEIVSEGKQFRNEQFYNAVLGSDFYIDSNNVLTLSGSFAYEVEAQPSQFEFTRRSNGSEEERWTRKEETSATNPKLQYELQYKREFRDDEDHKLLFSAIGNYFGKEQSSVFTHEEAEGTPDRIDQLTATAFSEGKYTFILDYTKPFNENWTVETGLHYLINDVDNDFEVQNETSDGSFEKDPGQTNLFEYSQDVLGVYGTGSYEGEAWGLKLGLRVENTDLNTFLVETEEGNSQIFTNLFPTAHASYKLSERVSFQAGYSRRIFRPRLWDLNPFFNIRNNFNIRAGNPNLLPEFTDSYEMGAIFILDNSSFNVNVYHRYTQDKVERVSLFSDGVTTWIPQNIGTNKATGVELNFKYSPFRKISFNGDANYNVFVRNGSFEGQNFDFSADVWSAKVIAKYKYNKSLDLEVTTRYQSREQTVQGLLRYNLFADFGFRYKIMNGKGVFNFSIRDIFASRIRQNTIDNQNFYSYSWSRRGRFITLGFSYGFGKGEAMYYSGRRR